MPQINRIRVNNVKYNFGTQYYDDFMMRFSGRNTIYDLANGGGKSLLMLLLLQNMLPNCTLDEKQPIEKLFRKDSGNTVIHSLIEWNLEPCYQKDNFRYMVTGFCARKAKDGEDGGAVRDTASVEYYNYCIFYREFGENDIKNLPLQKGDKKITYQELKDYLRDLEKNAPGLSVRIFDRKGDYQSFIGEYGIYESEWEIIRGINKTEGHVRTYFETNYRTSRKVVEDLLIEEIIQKSFANRFGAADDDARMAQTLLDIKDKLVELSKKHGQIHKYDEQMRALDEFGAQLADFKEIFAGKEKKQHELVGMLFAARKRLDDVKAEGANIESNLSHIENELVSEQRLVDIAEVVEQQAAMDEVKRLNEQSIEGRASLLEQSAQLRNTITLWECLEEYDRYMEYARQLEEINQIMDNRLRDHEDIASEMRALASLRKSRDEAELAKITDRQMQLDDEIKAAERELDIRERTRRELEDSKGYTEGRADLLNEQEKELERQLADAMQKALLVVPEEAKKHAGELEERIAGAGDDLNRLKEKLGQYSQELSDALGEKRRLEAELAFEQKRKEDAGERLEQGKSVNIEELEKVYGSKGAEALVRTIGDALANAVLRVRELKEDILGIETYVDNLGRGRYVCDGTEYHKLWDYLVSQYGDDVMTGTDWYATLNLGQKRDVIKRVPFVHYGFVIKNDFERIKEDGRLWEFNKGSYAIPIISENVIYDMKLEVNTELVVFSARNLSFLNDAGKLETERRTWLEELEARRGELEHVIDRKNVINDDYEKAFARLLQERMDDNPEVILSNAASRCEVLGEELKKNASQLAACEERLEKGRLAVADLERDLGELTERKSYYDSVQSIDAELSDISGKCRREKEKAKELEKKLSEALELLRPARELVELVRERRAGMDVLARRIQERWQQYDAYYDAEIVAGALKVDGVSASDLDDDRLDGRFLALKSIVEQDSKDISDKEKLKNHFAQSMERCKKSIEYKGRSFDEVKAASKDGDSAGTAAGDELRRLEARKKLGEYDVKIRALEEQIDSQSALYNRLDGSIAHGIHQIEERYGSFEAIDCGNPTTFIERHKALMQKLKESKKKFSEKQKKVAGELTSVQVSAKDMERIIRNSGLEDIEPQDGEVPADYASYEEVQAQLESFMRREVRRREGFAKEKRALAAKLRSLDGEELAQEIEQSLEPPVDADGCEALERQLKETNSFIGYEKERISESVQDMERIKESFENRCIQTCSNIRTELDRLPQLSTINMDGDVIRMIGLQIPYVKEEQYRERMSDYIDETVTGAESFATQAERLQFIRNRLTWKRMFSVIVTDMNLIRVNLYKRERIKDQSRYLKYEEAVGSTGQSQGIYIQFLIGIINYISNVNAPAREAAVLKKTVFIDNPFGAAKDIYIWEPIFKLLSTNHVQLIVPARGATPAITGRFDVNYILGQKMVDSRQQTVVVDYQSRVDSGALEYEKIEYEQQSLNIT